MTRAGRWTLVGLAVLAVIAGALLYQVKKPPPEYGRQSQASEQTPPTVDAAALAGLRREAQLPPCVVPADGSGPAKLSGVQLDCAADGSVVDVARMLAGRTVVLNLWAYWCKPCADELPAMAEYQRTVGDRVLVVTVHQDANEAAGLQRLVSLGVRLPTLQDGQRRIAAALGAPNVMPTTVVIRPDGSVAKIMPQAFTSADEIAQAVTKALQ